MKYALALLLAFSCASAHGAYSSALKDKVDPSISTDAVKIVKVTLSDYSGNTGSPVLGSVTVTGTLTVNGGVSLHAGTNTIGNVGITSTVKIAGVDGATVATNTNPVPVSATVGINATDLASIFSKLTSTSAQTLTNTSIASLTSTATTTYSITFTAASAGIGCAGACREYLVSIAVLSGGASGVFFYQHDTMTAPTTLSASIGNPLYPGDVSRSITKAWIKNVGTPAFSLRPMTTAGPAGTTVVVTIEGR